MYYGLGLNIVNITVLFSSLESVKLVSNRSGNPIGTPSVTAEAFPFEWLGSLVPFTTFSMLVLNATTLRRLAKNEDGSVTDMGSGVTEGRDVGGGGRAGARWVRRG